MTQNTFSIEEKVQEYYRRMANKDHRYRSWEHCYRYFRTIPMDSSALDKDTAALHLGFYLASWGMYRGSSFLLQRAYTAHNGVVDKILQPQFKALWGREFGASDDDTDLVNVIFEVIEGIRDAYRPMAGSREASNTLVTKVILGTFGSLPAVDRYFVSGFKSSGRNCSGLDIRFVTALLEFASENRRELGRQQLKIEEAAGIKYPIMKLVDMYFWQIGADTQKRNVERELALVT
jgi:hypothetical protein